MSYFWGVLLKSYKEFEERIGTLKTGKGSKAQHIASTIETMIGPFLISDIEHACSAVSRDTIRLVLRNLRDAGAILPQGKGCGSKWIRKKA